MNVSPPRNPASSTSPPILVLLGGGRGNIPNFWAARACRSAHIYYIPCQNDSWNRQITEKYLKEQGLPHTILDAVPAFDPDGARRSCARILADIPEAPVLISMTQSPKLMAVGAEMAVRNSGRGDVSVFHANTVRDVLYTVTGPPPIFAPFPVVVDDYLSAYGFTGGVTFSLDALPKTPEYYGAIATLLASPSVHFHDFMRRLHTRQNQTKRRAETAMSIAPPVSPSWMPLLQGLQSAGLIKGLVFLPNGISEFCAASDEAWRFLSETWLTVYAVSKASALKNSAGQPIFADCRAGLSLTPIGAIPNGSHTIDLACVTANGLLLCAICRTQAGALVEGTLDQMVSQADDLGRDYCVKMLIASTLGDLANKAFYTKAADRNIMVVSGEDLLSLPDHMLAAMANAPGHSR